MCCLNWLVSQLNKQTRENPWSPSGDRVWEEEFTGFLLTLSEEKESDHRTVTQKELKTPGSLGLVNCVAVFRVGTGFSRSFMRNYEFRCFVLFLLI